VERKWFNFFVLLVVLALIAGAFFLLPAMQQSTFEKQYDEMSSAWKNAGFNRLFYHSSAPELEALSTEKLQSIKSSLSSYNSQCTSPALADLSSAYIVLTDYIISKKELGSLMESLPAQTAASCAYLQEYEDLLAKAEENITYYNEYVSLANAFVSSYPGEAAAIDFSSVEGESLPQEEIESLREGFNSIKEKCA